VSEEVLRVGSLHHEELGQEDELPASVFHQTVLLTSKQLFVGALGGEKSNNFSINVLEKGYLSVYY
jgi:hypothetical protein